MLVILHGWSDNAGSFKRLGERLVAAGATDSVTHMSPGDYISLDDHVTFDDLSEALQAAWIKAQLIFRPDRTVLADLVIRREQRERAFRLLPLK